MQETIGMTIDSGDTVTNTEFEISACERAVYDGVLGRGAVYDGVLGRGAVYEYDGVLGRGAVYDGVLGTGAVYDGVLGTGAVYDGVLGRGAVYDGVLGRGAVYDGVLGRGALTSRPPVQRLTFTYFPQESGCYCVVVSVVAAVAGSLYKNLNSPPSASALAAVRTIAVLTSPAALSHGTNDGVHTRGPH
jgi:hypothetical protein